MDWLADLDYDRWVEHSIMFDMGKEVLLRASDEQLKKKAKSVIEHPNYIENEHTSLIKNVLRYDNLSPRRRNALAVHILKWSWEITNE